MNTLRVSIYEYSKLTTKTALKSRHRPGYVHPAGSEATFLEAQPLPDSPRKPLPVRTRRLVDERGEPVWLIEVHAPDSSLIGGYWHEVFEVPYAAVNIEDDGGLGEFLKAAKSMETIGSRLIARHAGHGARLAAVVVDVLVKLARSSMKSEDLVQALRGAWENALVTPRDRHEARPRVCAACESGACIGCGLEMHDDGSRVTWRCNQCGHLVCRGCTLTIPNRKPPEYYHQTFCGTDCWHKAGKPRE